MPNAIYALASAGVDTASTALDFSDALTTSLGNVATTFGKYALIAIPIGLGIWAAPKALKLVMKFFNALSH